MLIYVLTFVYVGMVMFSYISIRRYLIFHKIEPSLSEVVTVFIPFYNLGSGLAALIYVPNKQEIPRKFFGIR